MVNFHACRLYIENNGGFTLTTPHLDGFKCTLGHAYKTPLYTPYIHAIYTSIYALYTLLFTLYIHPYLYALCTLYIHPICIHHCMMNTAYDD